MKWHWYVQIDAQQSIMIKVPLYFFKVRFDTSSKMQTYLLLYLVGKNGLKWGRFYLWGMRRIFMIKIFVNFAWKWDFFVLLKSFNFFLK